MFFDFLNSQSKIASGKTSEKDEFLSKDYSFPLRILENKRTKRFTLRIDIKKQIVCVTVPPKTGRKHILNFLETHHDWLKKKIIETPKIERPEPGKIIFFQGIPHLIVHEPEKRGVVKLSYDERGPLLIVYGQRPHVPRRIRDFLKKEARKLFEDLITKHTLVLGKKARSFRLKDTSSRWGSCSASGDLCFSWRIVMAPPSVMDYLVAHEVAHLKEMNHKRAFWTLCTQLFPDTQTSRKWLKHNGSALQCIRFDSLESTEKI